MKQKNVRLICCLACALCFGHTMNASPIAKHPDNPHYFIYKGKPLVLITTDQHYGAVINLDFDYVPFLDRLHEYGMNLTRIYPGAYVEIKDQYTKGNPMGPSPGRYILPWMKSTISGADANLGVYKYDLESWDEEYFMRLKDFVKQASLRDIIVEVAFFNGMYDDRWKAQPIYHTNNIQRIGTCEFQQYTTGADRALTEVQLKYVKKIALELKDFDNLIYDISDEPEMQKQDSWAWNSVMLDALISVDQNRHLCGETANSASPDFTRDPRTSWIPTEYISPMEKTLDDNYSSAKPIVNVETGYYPFWYTHPVEETRVEGWYGMLGGLAGLIHLNGDFSTFNPSAEGTSTEKEILPQKRVLMQFMQSLDFVKMTKFTGFQVTSSGVLARAIAEPGKQYAVYLFHGSRKWDDWPQGSTSSRFNADLNWFRDSPSINIPPGTYKIEWINPASGALIDASSREYKEGNCILQTPRYYVDIALRMRRLPDSTALNGATITINGATTHQTIDGFGVNVNTTWWHNGVYGNTDTVKPAIDMLINDLGSTIFRAVIEEMDWEAVNDDADSNHFNWSYYNDIFSNAKFHGVWNTLRYLNQKGIKDRLVISFMGTPPGWLGSNHMISTTMEDEFVETIAALLYYARHTAGIQFTLVSPMNETEQVRTGWYEGPNMLDAVQFARVLKKLAIKLDAIGMNDIRFIAPDAASEPFFQSLLSEMVKNPVIMSKLFCWGIHNYGNDSGGYNNYINSSASENKSYWVTETCGIANLFGQLDDNPKAFIFWDGFDSVYQHAIRHDSSLNTPPNDWCFWMKTEEGKPLIAYDSSTKSWTPRKQFYEHAQLFKHIAPGAVRVGATADNGDLAVYAYRNPDGKVAIVGRNSGSLAIAANGTLSSIHVSPTLSFTYTTPTQNMVKGTSVTVNDSGAFSVTIPANCVFTLSSALDVTFSPQNIGRP